MAIIVENQKGATLIASGRKGGFFTRRFETVSDAWEFAERQKMPVHLQSPDRWSDWLGV